MIYKTENRYYLKAQQEKLTSATYQVLHKKLYNLTETYPKYRYTLDSHYNFSKQNQRMATIKKS